MKQATEEKGVTNIVGIAAMTEEAEAVEKEEVAAEVLEELVAELPEEPVVGEEEIKKAVSYYPPRRKLAT